MCLRESIEAPSAIRPVLVVVPMCIAPEYRGFALYTVCALLVYAHLGASLGASHNVLVPTILIEHIPPYEARSFRPI